MHRENGIRARIEVLPLFSSVDRPAKPPEVRPNRVVFAGRVMTLKGIANLVRVAADMPDIELVVIGEGELRSDLAARYASHPNIRFLGKIDQKALAEHYASAAAIVIPSIVPETFGLTLVEAAACGTPAIVGEGTGGAAEIVQVTGGGLLYDGDAELAEAIRQMVSDRPLRDRLGALARAGYETRYTQERHVADYLAHVEEVLGKRN
jgi:glycosyltransferase involved in cell wall biosynthesis